MAMSYAALGNALHTGEKSYGIIPHRRRWYVLSMILMAISVSLLVGRGVNPGYEFKGGSHFTISGTENASTASAIEVIAELVPDAIPKVKVIGSDKVRVEMGALEADTAEVVEDALIEAYDITTEEMSAGLIGPTWGSDVSGKALKGLIIFIVLVSAVMSAYFRAWRMASAALVALVHDLVFTVGIYAGLGFEISPASVIGFLTILGYSLYDTVVVFDKVKENTANVTAQNRYTYAEMANLAVNQTLIRSINTSVVALLPVSAILFIGSFLLGAGTLTDISLALFIGMAVGTYSSIFVATPVEVSLREREPAIRKHTEAVLTAREAGTGVVDADGNVRVGALVRGAHKGVAAQPKRKRRS
ncbi:MAG: protein translocase subunit SecF [Demequinaceae bacterium]|nr:protein translocase subunit SecF [Demequinaceae bacterium]